MDLILAFMRRHPNRLGMSPNCLQCWITCGGLWPDHWSQPAAVSHLRRATHFEQMNLPL
jgi:hypothetical protein